MVKTIREEVSLYNKTAVIASCAIILEASRKSRTAFGYLETMLSRVGLYWHFKVQSFLLVKKVLLHFKNIRINLFFK